MEKVEPDDNTGERSPNYTKREHSTNTNNRKARNERNIEEKRSNRSGCCYGNMQFSKAICFAYKSYPLRERLALELDRKTREQFSRMRFGFFVNKRTDVKLVVFFSVGYFHF